MAYLCPSRAMARGIRYRCGIRCIAMAGGVMGQSKVPEFLVEKLKKQYGEDVAGRVLDG